MVIHPLVGVGGINAFHHDWFIELGLDGPECAESEGRTLVVKGHPVHILGGGQPQVRHPKAAKLVNVARLFRGGIMRVE